MPQFTTQQAFDVAVRHQQAGRLAEAEQLYRQVLAQQPNQPEALHRLGIISHQLGRHETAVSLLRRAIALRPTFPGAYINLGLALQGSGQLDEAIVSHRQAIALKPDFAEAFYNLGIALKKAGQLAEAIAAYRQAVALDPNFAEAHNNLANVLTDTGQLDQAIAAYRRAIALKPGYAEACSNLGNVLSQKGELDQSIAAYRQAIALRSGCPEVHYNLGNALKDMGQLDQAIAAFRQAIVLEPGLPEAHNNLGNVLKDTGRLDEAIAAFRQAIALRHGYPGAHSNLGNVLKDSGCIDAAIDEFRRAIALDPNLLGAGDNLVYALHFHPAYDAGAIAEELRRWNRRHAEPLAKFIRFHANSRDPERRLRIGYVSPDFRGHVIGRNLLPLFLQHDRGKFEIICYANVRRPDAITSQFQQKADCWRNILGLTDEQAVERIRDDRIDILVDLTLHMEGNRLLVFARKPAPVQVSFAGYPGSTGLTAIDYRLSDPYLDPPGMDESICSEQTIRLPDSFWCYDPLEERDLPVNPLPALRAVEGSASNGPASEPGVLTFGCLNNFCKINDGVLAVWAQVLRKVERSRLLLRSAEGIHRRRTLERLARDGINPGRIEFASYQPHRAYLELYHRIDLGLDSFPYNGHSTSLDSFWMSVPVVTLVGQTAVSRAGWCQLSNLGLTELAASNAGEFVRIAVELANDLPRLQALRSTLRRRMEQSPLMDAPKFARNIEAAYRRMWRAWCESGSQT